MTQFNQLLNLLCMVNDQMQGLDETPAEVEAIRTLLAFLPPMRVALETALNECQDAAA